MDNNFNSDNKKFKDKQGRWHTQALFRESYKEFADMKPLYTLKDDDYEGLPSIKKAYLNFKDPTGYRVATELLGGWEHWKKLCGLQWFQLHLQEWEEELEIKLKCEGIKRMIEFSTGEDSKAKDATKFLINKEWEQKRGRPSKEEKERYNKINEKVSDAVNSDFELLKMYETAK